jgi:hypothetical protein
VGADETATTLTVRATSTHDAAQSGTAAVTVCGITGFSIDGYTGTISGTDITVVYPYDDSSEITSLTPLITLTSNAAVSPSSGTAGDFTRPVTYTLTANNGFQAAYTVTVKNSSAKITGFSFTNPSAAGVIDETAKTITIEVPYSTTDMTAMTPTISISPKAAVSPASGTPGDFTNPATFTVAAEDGSTAAYTVTVTRERQGAAAVTLSYEDAAASAFPDTIALSKSGAGGKPAEQTLTVTGEYDTYQWRVDGTVRENGKTFVLKAASYTTGIHQISVEVTRNSGVYSKSGAFSVGN